MPYIELFVPKLSEKAYYPANKKKYENQLKRCYIGFLNATEIDIDLYQICFEYDI